MAHTVLCVAELLTSHGRFHSLLEADGYAVGRGPDPEPSSLQPTRLAEFGWMATKGTAWLMRRSRDLVPALAGLALREWLAGEGAGREGAGTGEPERLKQTFRKLAA